MLGTSPCPTCTASDSVSEFQPLPTSDGLRMSLPGTGGLLGGVLALEPDAEGDAERDTPPAGSAAKARKQLELGFAVRFSPTRLWMLRLSWSSIRRSSRRGSTSCQGLGFGRTRVVRLGGVCRPGNGIACASCLGRAMFCSHGICRPARCAAERPGERRRFTGRLRTWLAMQGSGDAGGSVCID